MGPQQKLPPPQKNVMVTSGPGPAGPPPHSQSQQMQPRENVVATESPTNSQSEQMQPQPLPIQHVSAYDAYNKNLLAHCERLVEHFDNHAHVYHSPVDKFFRDYM